LPSRMKPSQRPVQPGRDAILAENTQMVEDSKFVNNIHEEA